MKTEKTIKIVALRRVNTKSFVVSDLSDADELAIVSACRLVEFRCRICCRLLAKSNRNGKLAGEIKCPRCGAIDEI